MKTILFTVVLVVTVATALAQDAAQPAEEHAPNFRADGTPPDKMDFDQWEFILSKGSQADRDRVWKGIKGNTVQARGRVIKATLTEIDLALSLDDIDAKKADVTLTFQGPISANVIPKQGVDFIPKEGASLDFQGVISSYTRKPFMLTMEKGILLFPIVAPTPTTAQKAASQ